MELTQIEPRDTSELCVRCGVCCVVLKAYCTPEEAEATAAHGGVDVRRFVKERPNDSGDVLMHFPCTFLRGRVMSHVACAVYDGPRPPVCGSYLCKIAINYTTQRISLVDAIHALNIAFMKGDYSIFNWTGQDREVSIYLRGRIVKASAVLRKQGVPQAVIDYSAAAGVTPRYFIPTDIDHDLLSMHFFSHDHRMRRLDAAETEAERLKLLRAGLDLYFESELVAQLPDDGIRIAATAMTAVLNELRGLLVTQVDEDFRSRCGLPLVEPDVVDRGAVGGPEELVALAVEAATSDGGPEYVDPKTGEAVGQVIEEEPCQVLPSRSLAHEGTLPVVDVEAAQRLADDLGIRDEEES